MVPGRAVAEASFKAGSSDFQRWRANPHRHCLNDAWQFLSSNKERRAWVLSQSELIWILPVQRLHLLPVWMGFSPTHQAHHHNQDNTVTCCCLSSAQDFFNYVIQYFNNTYIIKCCLKSRELKKQCQTTNDYADSCQQYLVQSYFAFSNNNEGGCSCQNPFCAPETDTHTSQLMIRTVSGLFSLWVCKLQVGSFQPLTESYIVVSWW